uniref:Uncharacterized protein n=1 Tax=Oryza punctata TaxID=4537 RepID=A0A0E0MPB4_ORYPU
MSGEVATTVRSPTRPSCAALVGHRCPLRHPMELHRHRPTSSPPSLRHFVTAVRDATAVVEAAKQTRHRRRWIWGSDEVFVDLERGEAAAATASASPRLGGNVRSWSLPGGRRRRLPPGLVAWPASVKEQRCLPYPSSGAGSGLSGSGHLLLFPRKGDREGEERDASDAAMLLYTNGWPWDALVRIFVGGEEC